MTTYEGPIFDADNHLYETEDALTRYLPKQFEGFVKYVQVNGRTKIAINNHISESIPNPTFDVVAPPGAFADYFAGKNPEGKTLREMAGTPMRAIDAFRSAGPRLALLDETGVDAALMFPTLASLIEVNLLDDPEMTCTVVHAYNQWLHDEWTFDYQQRIFATPVVNPCLPERGIAELDWVARARRQGGAAATGSGRRDAGHPVPLPPRVRRLLARRSPSPASWSPCTRRIPATSGTPTSGRVTGATCSPSPPGRSPMRSTRGGRSATL